MKNMAIVRPEEVVAIFDNGEYTLDRYTVVIEVDYEEEGYEQFTVASNGVCSIWSVSEEGFDYESVTDEDTHIGKSIEWDELPQVLQNTIISYFEINQ